MIEVTREAEVIRQAVLKSGAKRVMLIGTPDQMSLPTIRKPLAASGVLVLVPAEEDRAFIGSVIARGITDESFARLKALLAHGIDHGAQGVVVTCPDLVPLVERMDLDIPVIG